MRIYLLRHGHSPSALQAGVASDAERPLSEEGRQAVRRTMEKLREKGARPRLILHSPLRRAKETAQEAAKALALTQACEVFIPLANQLSAQPLSQELLRRAKDAGELVAVGHQPQLGDLASFLTGGSFDLPTAGLIALDWPGQGRGSSLWTLYP